MSDQALAHLPAAAARLAAVAARPQAVAIGCVVVLSALGWAALGAAGGTDAWATLCRPAAALADAPLVLALWAAMVLAMMLPGAAPMILTYAEIADTAARKGERIVSPLTLAAGYCAVWLGFALAAALLQSGLAMIALPQRAAMLVSAALFAGAGLYQFTALKHACLSRCRSPFSFFFLNWKTTARGVFGLGLRQGLACLGCCWAMMALMLAAGVVNAAWMAALAVFMTVEKMTAGRAVSRLGGAALIGIGFLLLVTG